MGVLIAGKQALCTVCVCSAPRTAPLMKSEVIWPGLMPWQLQLYPPVQTLPILHVNTTTAALPTLDTVTAAQIDYTAVEILTVLNTTTATRINHSGNPLYCILDIATAAQIYYTTVETLLNIRYSLSTALIDDTCRGQSPSDTQPLPLLPQGIGSALADANCNYLNTNVC